MTDELVHYSVASGAATITLDSPHNRNALSAQLRRELRACLARAKDDEAVRVIVLTHTGQVFCSGMDLKEARGAGSEDQGVNEFPEILDQIWTSPKPVVTRLTGPARAGGVGMVAASDIVVAAREATFAFTEVRIGVVPAVISLVVLPRIAPRAAQELLLTGEVFGADRAAEIGLITAAVDAEKLDDEVQRYVRSLTLGGPTALAATKELLASPRQPTPSAGFAAMNALSARFFASEEGQEGITAFAQKRKPNWVPAD
ncbi:enoyl-CoA hydratase family protein [Amycolatopsis acidicola]|uniref:Enoyl-CoA hydratase family protein n=1 Tax=Amycolatopsis acidicola TaxID=2596893 RepID=A0A5N0UY83_9PSEU|nr:enoyl-CoA hydratase family protein [Amycolatopsis acidicola]KAA9158611.1 enoyl-CoA hydratase family protein [Amycolatopsis acidicola]